MWIQTNINLKKNIYIYIQLQKIQHQGSTFIQIDQISQIYLPLILRLNSSKNYSTSSRYKIC